jgi:hypothetical protein
MTGPANRMRPRKQLDEIGRFMKQQALMVSRYMGYVPEHDPEAVAE